MAAERAQAALRLYLDVQRNSRARDLPSDAQLRSWARAALAGAGGTHEVTLRLVDEAESAQLNSTFRHKAGPTNVLSFPFSAPPGARSRLLGDLVVCAPVVARESAEQHKELMAHWAHMVVHGVLHLRGYDHVRIADAKAMEALETRILARLGYPNPY
jgi:probable rRNA maturation factor